MATISICIPAYKRINYLKRLLDSIADQTYRDFEVIITDDSPDDSVKELCFKYNSSFPSLKYFKNNVSLGTPANWNYGISKASGEWIKLMHDDDWFSSNESLKCFADGIGDKKFIFSAYSNFHEESGLYQRVNMPSGWTSKILRNPNVLLSRNVIGPPSVTMIHRSVQELYDTRMKWRVDIDYYIRLLNIEKAYSYLDSILVNVGISSSQVTNYCIFHPEVELPEGLILLNKNGVLPLRNIRVYDAWWRIIRNTNIRSVKSLYNYTPGEEWPSVIQKIILHQSKISSKVLKIGFLSKPLMFASYILNQRYLKSFT